MLIKEEKKEGLISQFTTKYGLSQTAERFLEGIYANGLMNSENCPSA